MTTSIAIVTRGTSAAVDRLVDRLCQLGSDVEGTEVFVVAEDDSVDTPTPRHSLRERAWLVRIPAGRGLGYNRNRAIDVTSGDTIVFVDDDCWPLDGWLRELLAPLADPGVDAVMGDVRIRPSTLLGDSISALGFPGGGNVGFAVMFGVDAEGNTSHLSTLNCAIRRRVFDRVGAFDETMTAGGEDGELSYRISDAGLRIRHRPTAVVEHEARSDLREFAAWFFMRGRAACQFSRRVPAGPAIGNRLRSYRRIIALHRADPKLVVILPLLVASVALQQAGYAWEYATGPGSRR